MNKIIERLKKFTMLLLVLAFALAVMPFSTTSDCEFDHKNELAYNHICKFY